jgi:hypothetical protein
MLHLGAYSGSVGFVLEIPEHEIPVAYDSLLELLAIIEKWKSVSAKFRGKKVNLFKFLFQQYNQVAGCGSEKTKSMDEKYCITKYDIPTWGCRQIESLLLYNTGDGNYERSGIYWYNYGFFDDSGMWIIDKERIYARITSEIERKALDVCPYFNIAFIEQVVFRDLPDYIIPDNYSYRLHYQKVYENGNEVFKAVNIRHINDIRNAPVNKSIVQRINSASEYFKALPPDLPKELKREIIKVSQEINDSPFDKAFDKDGPSSESLKVKNWRSVMRFLF